MKFYEDIIKLYSNINFPARYNEISKVDKFISWYLADSERQFVSVSKNSNRNILDVDISAAFPTICKALYGEESQFIQEMDKISEKKGKNIFIATTLKESGHLHILNNISKMAIMGIIFDCQNNEDILLLELKKDGCTIACSDEIYSHLLNINDSTSPYIKMLLDYNFNIHITEFDRYIRSLRTSLFTFGKNIKIKGIYKHRPVEMVEIVRKLLCEGVEPNQSDLLNIYSDVYWKICKYNSLKETLWKYYICDNNRILSYNGRYEKLSLNSILKPRTYLNIFLYPALLSTRLEV